jgi:virulence-associated protein VagC
VQLYLFSRGEKRLQIVDKGTRKILSPLAQSEDYGEQFAALLG